MRKFFLAPAALLIALAIMLSGCNLISVDPIMQLNEDRAKLEREYQTVLAEYDGGTVAVKDILLEFYNELSYYYQMSASYGMGFGEEQVESLKQSAVGYALERAAQSKEAEARGITLTEAEIAEIETEAREGYDGSLAGYAQQMDGKTEEVRSAQAAFALFSEGYTYEGLASYLKAQKIAEKLHASVEAEVGQITTGALKLSATAFAVYTGSSTSPAVRSAVEIAAEAASDTCPYPGPAPSTSTTLLMPNVSSSGVWRYSSVSTARAFAPGRSSISIRSPVWRSEVFLTSVTSGILPERTSSWMRLTTRSGPTR